MLVNSSIVPETRKKEKTVADIPHPTPFLELAHDRIIQKKYPSRLLSPQ